jgi:hypothetical protein
MCSSENHDFFDLYDTSFYLISSLLLVEKLLNSSTSNAVQWKKTPCPPTSGLFGMLSSGVVVL